jgi:hypothetical protein
MKLERNRRRGAGGGWLLAVAGLLSFAGCRTSDTGRYQLTVVPDGSENKAHLYFLTDTATGMVARWNAGWAVAAPPDWNDSPQKYLEMEKQRQKAKAFYDAFGALSLAEKVAGAQDIFVAKFVRRNARDSLVWTVSETLKGNTEKGGPLHACYPWNRRGSSYYGPTKGNADKIGDFFSIPAGAVGAPQEGSEIIALGQPFKRAAADPGWFQSDSYMCLISSCAALTRTEYQERIFPAPPTIIEDVRAEIKRQEALRDAEVH